MLYAVLYFFIVSYPLSFFLAPGGIGFLEKVKIRLLWRKYRYFHFGDIVSDCILHLNASRERSFFNGLVLD